MHSLKNITSVYIGLPAANARAWVATEPTYIRGGIGQILLLTASEKEDERGGQGHTSVSLLHQSAT
jgi:hypothetical protein